MVLAHQSCVLEVLGVEGGTDEFLVSSSLLLATGFAQLPVCVDLVAQLVLQEIFLSLLGLQVDPHLVKRFFRAEVRLVVQELILTLVVLAHLLLCDLRLQELSVSLVLLLSVLLLVVLHAVHIVKR